MSSFLSSVTSWEGFGLLGCCQPRNRDELKYSSLPPETSPSTAKTEGCFTTLKALGSFLPHWLQEHSVGTIKLKDGAYEGELCYGIPHGKGTFTETNGNVYTGEFVDGKPHGQGTLTDTDKNAYTGHFVDDKIQGQGTLKYHNGNVYTGEFVDGKPQGQGTLKDTDRNAYTGHFVDDKIQGQGTLKYCDGNVYTGDFVDHKYPGQGTLTDIYGNVYTGEFVGHKCQGQGTLAYKSGAVYIGHFLHGKPNGQGTLRHDNGDMYTGEFVDGCPHGQGTLIYANKNVYTGDFFYGKRQGQGTLTGANGDVFVGTFFDNPMFIDPSDLGGLEFLRLSFGYKTNGKPIGYPLALVSNWFEEIPSYHLKNTLIAANKLVHTDPCTASKTIYEALQKGNSYLLPYGFQEHAMGLNLAPTQDGKFVDCEIFNSGRGLNSYHKKATVRRKLKFETMLRVRVPIDQLTPEKIEQLLKKNKFPTAKESYDAILSIPGAKTIPGSGIMQAAQKDNNCSLEWIFAFLKNKMSLEDYNKMRIRFFVACLKQAKENEKKGTRPITESIPEDHINRKFRKLLGMDWQTFVNFLGEEELRFVNDKYTGRGISVCPKGNVYTGEFVDDKGHGKGTVKFTDGKIYTGEFVDGKPQGKGTVTYPSLRSSYTGAFVNGRWQSPRNSSKR